MIFSERTQPKKILPNPESSLCHDPSANAYVVTRHGVTHFYHSFHLKQGFSTGALLPFRAGQFLVVGLTCAWWSVWQQPWGLPTRCQWYCPSGDSPKCLFDFVKPPMENPSSEAACVNPETVNILQLLLVVVEKSPAESSPRGDHRTRAPPAVTCCLWPPVSGTRGTRMLSVHMSSQPRRSYFSRFVVEGVKSGLR